jgi:hypothetical protein
MPKFKVGDKIRRIIDNPETLPIGTICTVEKTYEGNSIIDILENERKGYFDETRFEIVKPTPEEFKVGDKVKRISTSINGRIKKGQIYTIEKIYPNNSTIDLIEDDQTSYSINLFEKINQKTNLTNPNNQIKNMYNSISNVIKNKFKTKERKALEFFGIVNGNGGLTDKGQSEFIDFIFETGKTDKIEFVKTIIEAYDEENKKKC